MSRLSRWEEDIQRAKDELRFLRVQHLGRFAPAETRLPAPYAAKERFLEICALGGAICFEARLLGLNLQPHVRRNVWAFKDCSRSRELFLWVRPRSNKFKPWDAELVFPAKPPRKTVFKGSVTECLKHAKHQFDIDEAAIRLGGEIAPKEEVWGA